MEISVVICTHNRSQLLSRTLASINEVQRPKAAHLSILVVANACVDKTPEILRDYLNVANQNGWLPLKWTEEKKIGKSNALNKALSIIERGIVCFIDDDHRVDEDYFNAIFTAANKFKDSSLFCGKVIPDWTGNEPDWVHDSGEYRIYPLPVPHFELGDQGHALTLNSRIPGGGNLFARRELFDRIGKFSTQLGPQGHNLLGGEDSDFVLRALRAGEKLQYIPAMVQYHFADPKHLTLSYIIRKSFQRSRSITVARLTRKTNTPKYLWRKLLGYLIDFVLSFNRRKAKFYLVRISSVLGEIKAFRDSFKLRITEK